MHTQSQPAAGPQLQDVNTALLDTLVLEYLEAEDYVEDGRAAAEARLAHRLAALSAYQALAAGQVSNAVALVSRYCPSVLEDQRLNFRLKRQQFIELLRQANTRGDAAALACAREELAPLALDAYPEAYLDFKHALLMLVQPPRPQAPAAAGQEQAAAQQAAAAAPPPAKAEWSLDARQQLAESLHHTMLLELDCRPPSLALLLTYLLHLFREYAPGAALTGGSRPGGGGGSSSSQLAAQLAASPGGQLASGGLLREGRDAGPLPPDISGQGYAERDVQALMAAVGLPRLAALDALKACGGDAAAALAHELARLRLNTAAVDALVWEYASARGLLEPADGPAAVAAAVAAAAAAGAVGGGDAMDVDDTSDEQQHATPAAAAAATPPAATKAVGKRGSAAVAGSSGGSGSPFQQQQAQQEAASGAAALVVPPLGGSCEALARSASRSPPYKVPRWRSKQTPSRFSFQVADASQLLAAAQPTASSARQQQQQGELQQVVVIGGDDAAAPAAAAATSPAHANGAAAAAGAGDSTGSRGPTSSPRPAAVKGSKAPSAAAAASSSSLAEQLVAATRASEQQCRWQALQQQLKSQAAGSGQLSKQLEAQQQLTALQALLVRQGQYEAAEAQLEQLQPGLLAQHPRLLFEFKRCQFTALIEANELPAALLLVRSQLTPLAEKHPELLPALKASMALLLPGSSSTPSSSTTSAWTACKLWQALLPLLRARMGLEQPRLVQLLAVLLTAHRAWFRLQRCSDPFASALFLTALQQAPSSDAAAELAAAAAGQAGQQQAGAAAAPRAGAAAAPGAAGQMARLAAGAAVAAAAGGGGGEAGGGGGAPSEYGTEGGSDGGMMEFDEGDEEGLAFDEASVLQVMEVLELPRAAALELLAEHGGDAQAVIMALFGA